MNLPFFIFIILSVHIELYYCLFQGYIAYALGIAGLSYLYKKKCDFFECCEIISPNDLKRNLENILAKRLFGQPIAYNVLPSAIHYHINKKFSNKPLVLSLHGWTGSGKTFTSQLIADTLFKNGLTSMFVKKISPATYFPDPNKINQYKEKLINLLDEQVIICKYSLVIIEEIDKLHPELIDLLNSYLNNYNPSMNHMIFILTSNVGSDKIIENSFEFYKAGKNHNDFKLSDFEHIIRNQIYNDESSMKHSSLITSHVISHYIPYLPLERTHITLCIKDYINQHMGPVSHNNLMKINNAIFDVLEWWPKDLKLYSTSGCKQVGNKIDILSRLLF